MKTTTKFLYVATILALFVTLYACKGPAGDVGPAGSTGATGVAGVAGTSGVIYSPWITSTFSNTGVSTIVAPKLTQDILDKGDVRVYVKSGTLVFPLPFSNIDSLGRTALHLDYALAVGTIGIFTSALIPAQQFRYVLIPGGVTSGRRAAIDFNNYEAVKKEFDLPD